MEPERPDGRVNRWHLDRFEALLFDMDGVITDSMPYHYEAWRRVFETFGIHVSREEILKREGEQGRVTLEVLLSDRGVSASEEDIRKALDEKETIFRSLAKPSLFPGVGPLLRAIRDRGKQLALVTGTSGGEARANLPMDLLACFDVLVSGDTVKKGKPHPEPYRTALDLLGRPPHEALVIENAPYGIRSAKEAGLLCIALTTSLPAGHLAGADRVVRDLNELRDLLFGSSEPAE